MPEPFYLFTVIFLGLCLGSFATAMAWRVPRGIRMTGKERSACTSCGRTLGVLDLIPVFSWVFLQGKCRRCGAKISWRYPLIELSTLGLCLFFYGMYGFTPEAFALFALAPLLVSMAAIDFSHKIIPDSLNLAVLATGAALLLFNGVFLEGPAFVMEQGKQALMGALLYPAVAIGMRYIFMIVMKREPLGLGDVKFFGAAGFWLGMNMAAAGLFMIVSGLSGIVLALAWKKLSGEDEFPFGPALFLGFVTVLCVHPPAFFLQ